MGRIDRWSGLALLLFLTGCVAQPSSRVPRWYGQSSPVSPQDFSGSVEVDFETPTPQRQGELRRRGVQLPQVSERTADPRAHRDAVERRVTAVGFGLTAGGYLLYCEGVPLPVLVPESHVDLGLTSAEPLNPSIYPDRDAALAELAASTPEARHPRYAYYRGAGGALIVPTLFSPASTPRIAQTMLEVRTHLARTLQGELKVLLLNLTGTKVLQGVFSRVLRVGAATMWSTTRPRRAAAPATNHASPPMMRTRRLSC